VGREETALLQILVVSWLVRFVNVLFAGGVSIYAPTFQVAARGGKTK
jgi:hypothetical protein